MLLKMANICLLKTQNCEDILFVDGFDNTLHDMCYWYNTLFIHINSILIRLKLCVYVRQFSPNPSLLV